MGLSPGELKDVSSAVKSGKMSLLFDIGIPKFGIRVYHLATTFCIYS